MNNNNFLLETAQKGFRITVGAATSLIETVQNPQKRSEAISQIQLELNQKAQEWAQKGEITEQEAQAFVNNLLNQKPWEKGASGIKNPSNNSSNSSSSNNVNWELQELIEEIVALRTELEAMRQSEDNQ
ncbi:MAG: hypothetical protein QNJ65_02815 [Xenococcaceae cyanobacterium MO_234.B1]|nr:hypothetical protein [Xenococcaceae cyanobacterium MO_234.B1]